MSEMYWNEEDDEKIICPYCSYKYTPTYDETIIGDVYANCFEEHETQTFKCDYCNKRFTMTPYLGSWRYKTETIDGEATEEEIEELLES